VQNLTSYSCSAIPISFKGDEISRLSRLGRPIVTNGDDDALFPNYYREDFVVLRSTYKQPTSTIRV